MNGPARQRLLLREFLEFVIGDLLGNEHVADLDAGLRKSPSDSNQNDISWAPATYCIAHRVGGLDATHLQEVCQHDLVFAHGSVGERDRNCGWVVDADVIIGRRQTIRLPQMRQHGFAFFFQRRDDHEINV